MQCVFGWDVCLMLLNAFGRGFDFYFLSCAEIMKSLNRSGFLHEL